VNINKFEEATREYLFNLNLFILKWSINTLKSLQYIIKHINMYIKETINKYIIIIKHYVIYIFMDIFHELP